MVRTCFIGFAYPPSTTPLAELRPIEISDLRLETHHRGKVLILRAIGHAHRIQSVQNAFEDPTGNVDRLALYNEDPTIPAEELLPQGVVVAVKEPYYKATADGGYTIRIDHPSDMTVFHDVGPFVPLPFALPMLKLIKTPATNLKADGNNAYLRKEYRASLDCYNRALKVCTDDDADLKSDLLRNRAVVNLHLKRFEAALDDALEAVLPMSHPKAEQYNCKAYYRAGRAAYELRDFEDARAHFMKAMQMQAKDEQALAECKRTSLRLGEQKHGQYDFASISASASRKQIRLDHASFSEKVVVRDAGNRGRGLFSVRKIKAGDLVLCEKAFHVVYGWEEDNADELNIMLNVNTNRASAGSHALLFLNTVKNLRQNPQHAGSFLELYAGDYSPKCAATIIDDTAVIDTFQTEAIIEYNVFACPDVRTSDNSNSHQLSVENPDSAGIWVTPSYINHACDGNARRAFIGDLMLIHATKDIAKDEEILMPYRVADSDPSKTMDEFKHWRFKCECEICVAENKTAPDQRKKRLRLIKEADTFVTTHKQDSHIATSADWIKKGEALYAKLQATYNSDLFKTVPRLGLEHLESWLCRAYESPATPRKATEAALKHLENSGFKIVVKNKQVKIDRRTGCVMPTVIDAGVYAAHAYKFLDQEAVSKHFMDFAKETYRTMNGELRGFEDRYGKMEE